MRKGGRQALLAMLALLSLAFAGTALATTTLKNLSYQTLPGGKVQMSMVFEGGPVPQPRIFTTNNPARIAVDFGGTTNGLSQRHVDIGVGATSGVTVVSAGGRTRLVVELFHAANYQTRVDGDSLVMTIDNGTTSTTSTTASTIDPTKVEPAAPGGAVAISNIDFRRGANGAGRVLIDFTGDGVNPQVHSEDGKVIVDLGNTQVPANLARTLDVTDFATPVTSLQTSSNLGRTTMTIDTHGQVDTSAYQTARQYVVEIAPKSEKEVDKLTAATQGPAYTGSRITFNFQNISVRAALHLLADFSHLNLVASDSVGGSLTLRLVNVPWDQALDVILRAKSLGQRRTGNVIWIAPQSQLASYEEKEAAARIKARDNAPLISDYIQINYGKATTIAKLLSSNRGSGGNSNGRRGFLSRRGSVIADDRTNTLLINDTAQTIIDVRALIAVLDKPVRQVLIESRIVAATDSFSRSLGVQWGVGAYHITSGGHLISTGGNLSDATSLGNSVVDASDGSSDRVTFPTTFNVNLPGGGNAGTLGVAILGAGYNVSLELQAAQAEGNTEIISSPRVITANQQTADIQQGQQIGYVTFANTSGSAGSGTPTVQFKNAVLQLKVTPTITSDDRVFMKINVKKDALAKFVDNPGGGQVPQIDTRSLNTSVLVDNGQTVVLGGIYEITKANNVSKVPGLGDIPILGYLFRNKSRSTNKAELLIFVTPRILSETGT